MLTQLEHGTAMMVAGYGVMRRLPQPLYDIDPGVVDRLEEPLELRVLYQPAFNQLTLVDAIVVEDEQDLIGASILTAKLLEQFHEQHRVLALMFDPDQAPRMCV